MNRPGEYIGKDGLTHRWYEMPFSHTCEHQILEEAHDIWVARGIHPDDWPAAKAALDALIESEEEWVCVSMNSQVDWRFRRDGSRAEYRQGDSGWTYEPDSSGERIYRKGREVALQDVQELVEAVLAHHEPSVCTCAAHIKENRMIDLARKVKL